MTIQEICHKKSQFVTRVVDNELVLVPITGNIADMTELITMNETGSFIWSRINTGNTEEDILNAIVNEFTIDTITAQQDLEEFLRNLGALMNKY